MDNFFVVSVLLILSTYIFGTVKSADGESTVPPHIIFMMADDAGWNDFSFHGSPQIPTPNIDALALTGTILNSYYGSPLCTPTRGAIMTGKHPIHIRLQHYVIMGGSPEGLPLEEKLLPEYLKELGYSTHLIGKWHLGHSRKAYTPTYRGFDSHVGYYLGKQDYYSHTSMDGGGIPGNWGYDFRRNMTVDYSVFGNYDTDVFTDEAVKIIQGHEKRSPLFLMINHIAPHSSNRYQPIQAPKDNVDKFRDTIEDNNRRKYAGLIDKLDESVGLVVSALAEKKMLENSIIIFVSDNGAAPEGFDLNFGSNWPLRGAKNTLWEGGTRLAGCIWSPLIKNRVSDDLMHASDWLPTLFEAVGGNTEDLGNIDGLSLWDTLTQEKPSPRTSMLYNIDDRYNNSAIRIESWKLIQGNTTTHDLGGGNWDGWYGPSGRTNEIQENLIPQIFSSYAGRAIQSLGLNISLSKLYQIQKDAEVNCGPAEPVLCDPYKGPCIFNIKDDPCEKVNLAAENPEVIEELLQLLQKYHETSLDPIPRVVDPNSSPLKWGNVWTTWKDFE